MKIYYQKTEKDCLSAVIGTMLQIDPDTIPLFVDLETWRDDYSKWLLDNYSIVLFHYKYGKGAPYIGKKEYYAIGTLHQEPNKHSHAVILKCFKVIEDGEECVQSEIWHDPLGNMSPYEVKDLLRIELFVELKDILNKGE